MSVSDLDLGLHMCVCMWSCYSMARLRQQANSTSGWANSEVGKPAGWTGLCPMHSWCKSVEGGERLPLRTLQPSALPFLCCKNHNIMHYSFSVGAGPVSAGLLPWTAHQRVSFMPADRAAVAGASPAGDPLPVWPAAAAWRRPAPRQSAELAR